ncbi:DUF2330 domain-containing protein [Akkermansiaceae bacterium]|nr:DUF2330 domain-containing protein [Akkermansiaceae bacterium]
MSFKSTSLSVFFFLILLASSFGCCTAWRHGSKPVRIAAQEVLLIWDAERGVEHFVRRANFQSENSPKDFGFLVPTPTQPKLSEVPDRVFEELGALIKPRVETRRESKVSFMPLVLAPLFATAGSSTKDMAAHLGGVEVLHTAVVGGFEVSVLRASESGALIAWLEENGYDARPEISDWVAPYVEKKWIVTAFKYAADADQSHAPLTRASVCLSFGTEAPFFPYRVPRDIRVNSRDGSLLRLYFAGRERVLGEFEGGSGQEWNASTNFSNHDEGMVDILQIALGEFGNHPGAPDATWLTAFEDETWPGGAEDLYFRSSQDQNPITPATIIKAEIRMFHLPLDLVILGLILAVSLYRMGARRKQSRG